MKIKSIKEERSAQKQNELLKKLEQKIMIEKAEKLVKGIEKNNLSMVDIVKETRKARNKQRTSF